jgi:PAS domain S-box-containing protein
MSNDAKTPPYPDQSTQLAQMQFALHAAGVGTWNLDITNQTVWWDECCKRLYGLGKDDVVPYEKVLSYMHDEDRERVNQAVLWALNSESHGYYDIQFRTIGTQDGQVRWLHCRGQAYFDQQGIAYRFSGIAQEITEHKLAQQSLWELETKYQRLFNSLDEGFCTVRVEFDAHQRPLDYCFIDVNPTFEKQTGILNAAGRWMRQIAPGHEQHWFDIYGHVAKTGEERRFEAHAEELGRWYDVFAFHAGKPGEPIVGILFNDITKRKQVEQLQQQSERQYRILSEELEERVQLRTQELLLANQDLTRSNDNLQQFAYVASHDLQEPLRKIQQFGDLLQVRFANIIDEDGFNYLERMQKAAEQMSKLIRDLLAYSRIATRQQAFEPVSLNTVLADVLETLDWDIQQSGAQIDLDELPVVRGDGAQLGQLFQNLLTNGLKFIQPEQAPQIEVRYFHRSLDELPASVHPSQTTPFYHHISVHDQGVGFEEKYLDRIFQVFQRLHGKNQYSGTGVGLAICQRVVENHGGAITASSQPGQGATFSVYLPD